MALTQINTEQWPVDFWHKIIRWCLDSFGAETFGTTWEYTEDYLLFLSEENITLLVLRWAG